MTIIQKEVVSRQNSSLKPSKKKLSTDQIVSSEVAKYLKKIRKTSAYQAWFQDFQLNKDFYNSLFKT